VRQPTRVDLSPSENYSASDGVVGSIETVRRNKDGIGVGTVIGGIVGGVLGNQVGGGRGKDLVTVAGVVGGAVVGNQIEKNNKFGDIYRKRVRMDYGSYQTVAQDCASDLRAGDRAQLEGDRVMPSAKAIAANAMTVGETVIGEFCASY
jgi:outer membrane lipoprotein SlyB